MNNLTAEQQHEHLLEVENDMWVNLNKDLTELEKDPRFQRLIIQGYFRDFAVNQTSMLASDSTIREGKRGVIVEQLIAVSHLQDHFITIKNLGSLPPEEEEEENDGPGE